MTILNQIDNSRMNCHILTHMASKITGDSRLSPEGRVVVPSEVRRHLGLAAGDRVRFIMFEDGRVELITPRMMVESLWANNHADTDVDSGDVIRRVRDADHASAALSESEQTADTADEADEPQRTAAVLAALGLST